MTAWSSGQWRLRRLHAGFLPSRASLPAVTQRGCDLGLQGLPGTQCSATDTLGVSGHLSACFLVVPTHPWRGEEAESISSAYVLRQAQRGQQVTLGHTASYW